MTPEDVAAALKRLGLHPIEAGRLLGHTTRSVYRWLEGTREISPGIAIVLQLLLAGHVTVAQVRAAAAARDASKLGAST